MHRLRNFRTTLLAIGAALALIIVTPGLAAASSDVEEAAPQRCVTHVDSGIVACEGDGMTLEQARATAAGATTARDDAGSARASRLAAVHVATLYSGFLGQGSSLEVNASSGCTASTSSVEWKLGNVGSAMNDKASSVRVYAGCRVQLFDQSNCPSGSARYPSSGWAGTTNYVGSAMNDRTTCIRGT